MPLFNVCHYYKLMPLYRRLYCVLISLICSSDLDNDITISLYCHLIIWIVWCLQYKCYIVAANLRSSSRRWCPCQCTRDLNNIISCFSFMGYQLYFVFRESLVGVAHLEITTINNIVVDNTAIKNWNLPSLNKLQVEAQRHEHTINMNTFTHIDKLYLRTH